MVLLLWFLRIHAWTWSRKKTRHLPNILLCIQNGSKTVSSSKFACKLAWIRGMTDIYSMMEVGCLVMASTISDIFFSIHIKFFRIHIYLPNFRTQSKPVKQWPKRVKPKPGAWTAKHLNVFAENYITNQLFLLLPTGSQILSPPQKPQLHHDKDPRLVRLSPSQYQASFPSILLSLLTKDPILLLEHRRTQV